MTTGVGKQLKDFNPAAAVADADFLYSSQDGFEAKMTAAQVATYVNGKVDPVNLTASAALTGVEQVAIKQSGGLVSATLTTIAIWILSVFTILIGTATGLIARTIVAELLDLPVSVKRFGAKGDGTINDASAFTTTQVSTLLVPAGTFRISADTTIAANLVFAGGQITVDSGVTLTINGSINAPSQTIFKGAGVVSISDGIIDVTWYDGATGDVKWNFARRGLSDSGHHVFMFPQVGSQDPHAINTNLGWAWALAAPLYLDNTSNPGDGDSIITILTYSAFAATANIASVFYVGHNTLKTDVVNFPLEIRAYDLTTNRIACVYRVEGGGHHNLAGIQAWGTGSVFELNPLGSDQCNDIKLGYVYCAGQTDRPVKLIANAGANNSVTDCQIGFINCDGLSSGANVDCLLYINGTVTGFKIGKITLRGITSVAGYVDATVSTVLIENAASYAPGYLIEIGSILNGSNPAAAKCLVARDTTGSTGPKIGGICVVNGTQGAVQPAISLSYCNGAQIVPGYQMQVIVDSSCIGTVLSQCLPSQVTDSGVNTLINGHSYKAISLITLGASPFTYTNSYPYDVDFALSVSGGSISAANYTRGATTVPLPASGTVGSWKVSPGDNVAVSWSGTGTANAIPR